jgi:drug/metabolite transporter (DMT)-like permease
MGRICATHRRIAVIRAMGVHRRKRFSMSILPVAFNRRLAAVPAGLRGMACMLGSSTTISAMNGIVTGLSASLHAFEITFFRQVLGAVFMAAVFLPRGLHVLHTRHFGLHILRAVLNVFAMATYFIALGLEPMANVVALALAAPLFASLGAILFLRERMTARRWMALGLGLVGSLVILRPGFQTISYGMVMILLSNVAWSIALVDIKVLARTESSATIAFYAAMLQWPLALIAAVFFWSWPTAEEWAWLCIIGICGSLAQLSLSQAFREADATLVLPLDFTKLIWASLIGYFFFGQVPSVWVWIGGLIVFSGVFYNALQERGTP